MKADFHPPIIVILALLLVIIVGYFFLRIISGQETIQPGGYTAPKGSVECKTTLNCGNKGICISINEKQNFCGCLDDMDCKGVNRCVYNRCV